MLQHNLVIGQEVATNLKSSFPRSRALILLHSPFLKASSAALTALSTSSFEAASTCRKQRVKLWLKLGEVQGISKRTFKDAHRRSICRWLIYNVTTRCDRFQTKIIFLAVKQGLMLIAGVKRWKSHLSDSTWCQESIGGFCFTHKWRAASLRPSLTFDNFKPTLKRSIFKCISWLQGWLFWWWLEVYEKWK